MPPACRRTPCNSPTGALRSCRGPHCYSGPEPLRPGHFAASCYNLNISLYQLSSLKSSLVLPSAYLESCGTQAKLYVCIQLSILHHHISRRYLTTFFCCLAEDASPIQLVSVSALSTLSIQPGRTYISTSHETATPISGPPTPSVQLVQDLAGPLPGLRGSSHSCVPNAELS